MFYEIDPRINVLVSDKRSSLLQNYSKNIFPKDIDGKSE